VLALSVYPQVALDKSEPAVKSVMEAPR